MKGLKYSTDAKDSKTPTNANSKDKSLTTGKSTPLIIDFLFIFLDVIENIDSLRKSLQINQNISLGLAHLINGSLGTLLTSRILIFD